MGLPEKSETDPESPQYSRPQGPSGTTTIGGKQSWIDRGNLCCERFPPTDRGAEDREERQSGEGDQHQPPLDQICPRDREKPPHSGIEEDDRDSDENAVEMRPAEGLFQRLAGSIELSRHVKHETKGDDGARREAEDWIPLPKPRFEVSGNREGPEPITRFS